MVHNSDLGLQKAEAEESWVQDQLELNRKMLCYNNSTKKRKRKKVKRKTKKRKARQGLFCCLIGLVPNPFLSEYIYAVYILINTDMYGGQRMVSGVFSSIALQFIETGFSLNLEFVNLANLTSQLAQEIPSQPPMNWDYRKATILTPSPVLKKDLTK